MAATEQIDISANKNRPCSNVTTVKIKTLSGHLQLIANRWQYALKNMWLHASDTQ